MLATKIKYKAVALILVLLFFVSPIAASRAHAQWVDPAQLAKEYGLDVVGWLLVNLVIDRLAASTIDWINNGFQGSPAFITNPDKYFKNLADGVAGQMIYNHPDLKFMCSPFKAQVQIALTKTYANSPYQFQCTLGEVANNWENFMDDFSQGGWEGFINMTQNSQNNPIGLYLDMQNEMAQKIQRETSKKTEQLNQGRGFLSYESCDEYGTSIKKMVVEGGKFELQPDGTNKYIEGGTREVDEKVCLKKTTKTPGSVIENQLNNVLGSAGGRLEAADELNEIVSSLLNQLVSKAMGGLLSLSKPSGSNDKAYTDQLQRTTGRTTTTPINGKCPSGFNLVSENECVSQQDMIEDLSQYGSRTLEAGLERSASFIFVDGEIIDCRDLSVSQSMNVEILTKCSQVLPSDTSGIETSEQSRQINE